MDLLLADGDDGSPILEDPADPSTAAAKANRVSERTERYLADHIKDADDLVSQRWGVIAPAGEVGDRLLALVQPLIDQRATDQQVEVREVLKIRVPPDMDSAAANAWKATEYPKLYGERETRRPRYLLILGDLDRVSLDTQHVLSQDGITGRLACTDDDGYGAYVHKVLKWQRAPSQQDRARALFYTVLDGSSATTAGYEKLIVPCHKHCERARREEPRTFPASAEPPHGAETSGPDELLQLAAASHPSVLLSMSHGLGPPRSRRWSPAEARDRQGAMSFGTEGALGVRDLASAPFLPGGLWIYFACFGAGTPRTSAYHHWLQMLADQGMAELGPVNETLRGLDEGGGFVSGLGKAVLANPDGPLAMLSHIDLAWSYSYEELWVSGDTKRVTGSNRSVNFFNLISKLVTGSRAGAASLMLKLGLDAVSEKLNDHYDRCKQAGGGVEGGSPEERLALGNLWMLHQDLRGFMLLGDPAVRLPLASRDRRPAPPAPIEVDADALERLERLERAALAALRDENASPGVIALDLRLQRSEVEEAARVYREAGRAALQGLLGREQDEEGKP